MAEPADLVLVDRSHDPTASGQFLPTLAELERAEAVAGRIANSGMVPSAIRGDAGATLGVILAGRELGIGPMQALRDIDWIDGKPAASAKLQRELLRRAGHEVELQTAADDRDRATYRFRRREWPADRWVEWTFTIEQALQAGLVTEIRDDGSVMSRGRSGRPGAWETYTAAMLRHRALSSLTTEWCPEVLGAVQYTAEELGAVVDADGRVIEVEAIDRSERSTLERAWLDLLDRADSFSAATGRYLREQRAEAANGGAFSAMPADTQERWLRWGEDALALAMERRGDTPTPEAEVEEVDGEIVDAPDTTPPPETTDVVDGEVEEATASPAPQRERRPWRMTDQQRKKLQATLAEAHVDDDLRHTLAGLISDGRTRSSGELTRREFDQLLALGEHLRDDAITVDYDQDGTLMLTWAPARGGGHVDLQELGRG